MAHRVALNTPFFKIFGFGNFQFQDKRPLLPNWRGAVQKKITLNTPKDQIKKEKKNMAQNHLSTKAGSLQFIVKRTGKDRQGFEPRTS